ncbi:MAG TPA: septal ring lytic transglycosylase RlpA family protein [Candidatus Omnitrophota bacterium]|nr:septal ring lytic transglycosylase RlpA family protein [Candidatus Omnitrophota bacterium]
MRETIKIITIFLIMIFTVTLADAKIDEAMRLPPKRKYVVGQASWYSKKSPGINKHTANNEIFDDRGYTCAIWGVKFNQRIKVTNLANGKSIIVRVNDRGPHKRFVRKGRVIDLTKSAFAELDDLKLGLIDVALEFI